MSPKKLMMVSVAVVMSLTSLFFAFWILILVALSQGLASLAGTLCDALRWPV